MTAAARKSANPLFNPLVGVAITTTVIVAGMAASPYDLSASLRRAGYRLKTPDLHLLFGQPPEVLVHVFGALAAFLIGCVLLAGMKGTALHKTLGWAWVVAMAATALSSFFLHGLNGANLSPLHLLSGWTVIALPMAIFAIRRRNVAVHRRFMTGMFVGGLVIAGLFTFLPGRLMWEVFFR